MKNFTALIFLTACSIASFGQDIEKTIRDLEQLEREAVLKKDTTTLRKIWSHDFTVNAPINKVMRGGKNTLDRPVITSITYSSFERNVENVLIKGDVAFAMGNEVVVQSNNGSAPRTVNRRYTNIWKNENGQWKLVARHANDICQKP